MLKEILNTLKMHTAGVVNGGVSGGVNPILDFITQYPGCRANAIAEKLNMPITFEVKLQRAGKSYQSVTMTVAFPGGI